MTPDSPSHPAFREWGGGPHVATFTRDGDGSLGRHEAENEAISRSGCECLMQAAQQRSGPTCPSGPQGLRHTRSSGKLEAWVRETGKLLPEQKPGRMLQPTGSTPKPPGKKEAE